MKLYFVYGVRNGVYTLLGALHARCESNDSPMCKGAIQKAIAMYGAGVDVAVAKHNRRVGCI